MSELRVKEWIPGESDFFYMAEIEVDGVKSKNTNSELILPMFNMKYEEDSFGNPMDVGRPMEWRADILTSETHWITCAVLIPVNSQCPVCNKRGE